ncbi:MAG: hypothetical protein Q9174_006020, partial [Haloplaca sp. 1 TL-2023]
MSSRYPRSAAPTTPSRRKQYIGKPAHRCKTCQRIYSTPRDLQKHIRHGSCQDQAETANASSTDIAKYSTDYKCIQCQSYHASAKKLAAHRQAHYEDGICPGLTTEEKAAQPLFGSAKKSVPQQQLPEAPIAATRAEETSGPSTVPGTKNLTKQDSPESPDDTNQVEKTPPKSPRRTCLYPRCGKTFNSGMDRDLHIRQEHAPSSTSMDKPTGPSVLLLRCPEGEGCTLDMSKVDQFEFQNHLELTHDWCIQCSNRYSSIGELRLHLREHTRPPWVKGPRVACADSGCSSIFSSYGQMMAHYWDAETGHPKVATRESSEGEAQFTCPIGHLNRRFHTEEEAIKHFKLLHRPTSGKYAEAEAEPFDDEDLSILESMGSTAAKEQLSTGNDDVDSSPNSNKHDHSDGSDSDQPLLKKYRRSRAATAASLARSDGAATDAMDMDVSTQNGEAGSDVGSETVRRRSSMFIDSDEELSPVRESIRENQRRRRPTAEDFYSVSDNTTTPNETANGEQIGNTIAESQAGADPGLARTRPRQKIIWSDAELRAQRMEIMRSTSGEETTQSSQKKDEANVTDFDTVEAATPKQRDTSHAELVSSPASSDGAEAMDWSPTDN